MANRLPNDEWEGVDELRQGYDALIEYVAVPGKSPVRSEEIAASDKLRPLLRRTLAVLDRQGIPHPDFDTDSLVIADTLKWSRLLSDVLAHSDDLDGARAAATRHLTK